MGELTIRTFRAIAITSKVCAEHRWYPSYQRSRLTFTGVPKFWVRHLHDLLTWQWIEIVRKGIHESCVTFEFTENSRYTDQFGLHASRYIYTFYMAPDHCWAQSSHIFHFFFQMLQFMHEFNRWSYIQCTTTKLDILSGDFGIWSVVFSSFLSDIIALCKKKFMQSYKVRYMHIFVWRSWIRKKLQFRRNLAGLVWWEINNVLRIRVRSCKYRL